MDRTARLLQGVDLEHEVGLEIGPLANPLVTRDGSRQIYYADYAPRDVLQEHSRHDPDVDIERIPEIDFVVPPPLPEDLGRKFDYIVASHVIEHVPDFLGWITTLFKWLSPNGRIILAVPDKRRCFDYLRHVSTTGAVLEAYFDKRSAPSFGTIYDAFRKAVRFDTSRSWREDPYRGPFETMFSREAAFLLAEAARKNKTYQDCHSWVFTYESFREIIDEINELGITPIKIICHSAPVENSNEFHVTLASGRKI